MAEVEKPKRSFSGEIPPLLHPSISLCFFDFLPNAPRHSSSKNHVPSASPFPAKTFFLHLIFFVTIVSIFQWKVTVSIYEYRERSMLASLFGGDSSSILPSHPLVGRMNKKEEEFWKQEAGEAYKPCLDFSLEYRKKSVRVSMEKRRFLVVSVSGDLYQLRNQIIDAVVIARILGAALVVSPFLKFESGVRIESGLSDIFDVEHFGRTLRSDVRVVESHPYAHLSPNQAKVFELPRYVTPEWVRAKFLKQLNDDGVLLLTGIESKLTQRLPRDLQKLRCKVAFHALRFADPIREIGYRLAKRIWIEGPYAAFDLGLKDDAEHSKGYQNEELIVEIAK